MSFKINVIRITSNWNLATSKFTNSGSAMADFRLFNKIFIGGAREHWTWRICKSSRRAQADAGSCASLLVPTLAWPPFTSSGGGIKMTKIIIPGAGSLFSRCLSSHYASWYCVRRPEKWSTLLFPAHRPIPGLVPTLPRCTSEVMLMAARARRVRCRNKICIGPRGPLKPSR